MLRFGVIITLTVACLTGQAFAWFSMGLDEPIPRLEDHTAVDIVYDGTYIWLATGSGLSRTSDGGFTWQTFNEETGFRRSSVSALTTDGLRVWAATAYEASSGDAGGALHLTEDYGLNWEVIQAPQMSSPLGRLAYEVAALDSMVWAACFYGGLARSLDYGRTWESIYIDAGVEADQKLELPQLLRGRYFTTVIDPYHDDTVIVWAGSAEGVQRLYYIDKSKKLASNQINDISADGTFWWYATDRGLSRLNDTLFSLFTDTLNTSYTFLTYDSSDGFPGNYVSAVGAETDLICAGIYDTLAEQSQGFVVSTDGGITWSTSTPPAATGAGKLIEEVEVYEGDIWAGCNQGGLIRSTDQGLTWIKFRLDTLIVDPLDSRNIAHGFDIAPRDGFTKIHLGTDSGLVVFYFSDMATLDSTSYLPIADNPAYGQRIVSVTSVVVESEEQIWAAAHPLHAESTAPYAVIKRRASLPVWEAFLNQGSEAVIPYDVEVYALLSTVSIWVAHNGGLYSTTDFGLEWNTPYLRDQISRYPSVIVIDDDAPFLCVEAAGSALHIGSLEYGTLEMVVPISDWFSFPAQTDPLRFDLVGRSYRQPNVQDTSTTTIGGNFIVAMGLQRTGDSTIIWAGTNPTDQYQRIGVSMTADRGRTWTEVAEGVKVWNFEFNGDSVFLASSDGLMLSTDFGTTWDEYTIYDPTTGRSIADDVWVLSCRLVEGELWVGTNDGIAKSTDGITWEIFRTFQEIDPTLPEEDRSYVSPNPYSPFVSEGSMKFHYVLDQGGEVTITIYDFANNLVKVVRDRVPRAAGEQYDDIDSWDGTNERGDFVAGGVYIYVIESSGGDELWGKFMVLP